MGGFWGFRLKGLGVFGGFGGFRLKGSGFRGFGFRLKGLGFRALGVLGFRRFGV